MAPEGGLTGGPGRVQAETVITALALRVREAFGRQPQLAAVWGRYASGGAGPRLVMEEVPQALRASGLPDEEIPARCHRLAVLTAALIASEAGVSTITPEEYEQGRELFRVAVLGADPEHFPALAHFARDVRPLGVDRRAAFEEILAAQLAHVEAAIPPGRPTGSGGPAHEGTWPTTGSRPTSSRPTGSRPPGRTSSWMRP